MTADKKEARQKVRLVPVSGRYIPGVPAIAMTVSASRAAELLAYTPAAFVEAEEPPAKPVATKE